MKIQFAGRDRTEDIGARIQAAIRKRSGAPSPAVVPPDISALNLLQAKSEAEYQERLLRLIRYRDNVDTLPFDIPRRPGLAGALLTRVKVMLWKLLRYQHDRITGRQNLINSTYSGALEYEHRILMAELEQLKKRMAALESQMGGADGKK